MKNYRVIISGEITVKADSKEEAEQLAIKEFKLKEEITSDKFDVMYHNLLEFDAILNDIQNIIETKDEKGHINYGESVEDVFKDSD